MYLTSVRLENIKCFEDITLHFKAARKPKDDHQLNWNVILGDNGDGKTTLLRAIAGCLMDTGTATKMMKLEGWIKQASKSGTLQLEIRRESGDLIVEKDSPIDTEAKDLYTTSYQIWSGRPTPLIAFYPDIFPRSDLDNIAETAKLIAASQPYTTRESKKGWVSCGYGPFRRAFGPSSFTFNITDSLEERFITLFEEGAALYKYEEWLKDLERLALKNGTKSKQTFETVKQLLPKLLPGVKEIKIEEHVQFVWDDKETGIEHLSDGYRSMFVMMADLLRWLEMMRSDENIPLNEVSGVVLIDEVDAHLHPKWQREIGFLLTKTFPNIQFIVTTHSPFVAMAAGKDALTVLHKEDDTVTANQDTPYIRDWAVDQVITEVFGEQPYSQETEDDLAEYEELRSKQRAGILDKQGQKRLAQLEPALNERLSGDDASPKQKALAEDIAYLKNLLVKKREQTDA